MRFSLGQRFFLPNRKSRSTTWRARQFVRPDPVAGGQLSGQPECGYQLAIQPERIEHPARQRRHPLSPSAGKALNAVLAPDRGGWRQVDVVEPVAVVPVKWWGVGLHAYSLSDSKSWRRWPGLNIMPVAGSCAWRAAIVTDSDKMSSGYLIQLELS